MAATNAFKQAVADAVGALGATISLHSADPGTNGANELAGGGYAKKQTVWGAAVITGGNAVITGSTQRFDVEANDAALWYGVWSGTPGSPGSFRYGRPLTPGVTINSAGNGQVDVTPTFTYSQS